LANVLKSGRDDFNAKFAEAKRRYPELEAAQFSQFLENSLDPIFRSAAKLSPEDAAKVAVAGYEVGLQLVGERLVGNASSARSIEQGWAVVFPPLLPALAVSPHRLFAAFTNALYSLSITPGARPEEWSRNLAMLGPRCAGVEPLLKLGQILAWRSGLAHFRLGALDAARELPEEIVVAALGAAPSASVASLLTQLAKDPWFEPSQSISPPPQTKLPRVVSKVGAFRGFGGLFVEPPQVTSHGENLLVRSGDDCWWLVADVFGATLHRATAKEFETALGSATLLPELKISAKKITFGSETLTNPCPGEMSSFAAVSHTLALTSATSHRVILIAL